MFIQKNLPWVFLALLLRVTPSLADDAPKGDVPRLTEAQVVKIAQDFCRSIGITGLKPIGVLTPAEYRLEAVTERWHPNWRLRFNRQAKENDTTEVVVDDLAGDVVGYDNLAPTPVEDGASPIPKEQAVAEATGLLTKAGAFRGGELQFKDAVLSGVIINGKLDAKWLVRWFRQVKGVPYRYDGANVLIQAASGEVIGFSGGPGTPPPDRTDTNINKQQATAIAAQQLAAAGLAPADPPTVKEEVIRPTTFWQTGGKGEAPYVRLAWTLNYKIGSHYAEVWVDAQTGDVIGGEYSGSRGGLTLGKTAGKKAAPAQATPTAKPSAPVKK